MITDTIRPTGRAQGEVQCGYVPDNMPIAAGLQLLTPIHHNDLLRTWGTIVQRLLRNVKDGKQYHIGGMYLEFNNGGTVNPTPTIDRSSTVSYYQGLSGTRDFLRVGIAATEEENSDEELFPLPNVSIFYAQSTGSVGVNGKTFSDGVSSHVYGGALVAFCDADDIDSDIILSRFYLAPANQLPKVSGSQIGIMWKNRFE